MSRIHRVVEKAEREGQFSRTQGVVEVPPAGAARARDA